jgi:hypothetical protein
LGIKKCFFILFENHNQYLLVVLMVTELTEAQQYTFDEEQKSALGMKSFLQRQICR